MTKRERLLKGVGKCLPRVKPARLDGEEWDLATGGTVIPGFENVRPPRGESDEADER